MAFDIHAVPIPPKQYRAGKKRFFNRLKATFVFMLFVLLVFGVTTVLADSGVPRDGPVEPSFGGCYISTGKGLIPDLDCDKVPDPIDNCPLVGNPDQFDQTGNGLGDACDLIIENVEADPMVVLQGRSLLVHVSLANYREYDLRNLRLQVEVPVLGMAETDSLGVLPSTAATQRDIIMRVPDCASPGEYDLVFTVEYPYTAGKKEVFSQSIRIVVEPSGQCPIEPTVSDKTIVDVLELTDLDPVDGAVYPFTITNNEPFSKAYVLSIDGLEWGTYQIEPHTLVVVPGGESREGAIRVWANEDTEGEQVFLFTIQARDDIKQVQLLADIPEPPNPYTAPFILSWVLGILVLLALCAVVVIILVRAPKRNHK